MAQKVCGKSQTGHSRQPLRALRGLWQTPSQRRRQAWLRPAVWHRAAAAKPKLDEPFQLLGVPMNSIKAFVSINAVVAACVAQAASMASKAEINDRYQSDRAVCLQQTEFTSRSACLREVCARPANAA
jgi:hypothetical protein